MFGVAWFISATRFKIVKCNTPGIVIAVVAIPVWVEDFGLGAEPLALLSFDVLVELFEEQAASIVSPAPAKTAVTACLRVKCCDMEAFR